MDNNTTKRKYSAEELKKYKKRSMWAEVWRNFKKNRTAMVGLFIVVALIIYIDDPSAGPFFKQKRVGRHGQEFYMYKFRTMRRDAEKEGILRTEDERKGQMTKFGRILCDHHLDELPQFFNVLKGDMSLVGPRPERKFFIDQIMKENPNYVHIYKMRPGLTSMATLYNGYTHTMEKMLVRLDMDLEYLTTRSLWGDFVILVKTALSVLSGKKF